MAKTFKSQIATLVARVFSKSYHLTQIARRIVQVYDNDCNADLRKNGEYLLLKLIVSLRRDGVFVDVGANRGDWSAAALELGFQGRLFGIDPLPKNIANLSQRFSEHPAFRPMPYALTDTIGEAEFFSNLDESQSGTDSLYNMTEIGYTPSLSTVKVKCTTLDHLATELSIRSIDFLKIDVEGNEFFVLKGAQSLLSSGLIDFIQIEFGHAARATRIYLHDIVRFVEKYSYEIFVIKPNGFMPLHFTPFVENRYSYINFLIVRKTVLPELKNYIRRQ